MLQRLVAFYWQHPVGVAAGVVAAIIIVIWMSATGSRERFIRFRRTKETEQFARDLSRIASALERLAKSREMPADFAGRPVSPAWEEAVARHGAFAEPIPDEGEGNSAEVEDSGASGAAHPAGVAGASEPPARANPPGAANPLGGTANLLGGKKKLEIPNPLYRPK